MGQAMKRFTYKVYSQIPDDLPFVRSVWDKGFLRFTDGIVDAVYFVCTYRDGNLGFVKFDVINGKLTLNSFYHTVSKILEVRYDAQHNVIAEYVNYKDGDKQVYLKLIDGVKADEYTIDTQEKKEFPEFRKDIVEYIETDANEFCYFTKEGKETIYLQVK